MANQKRRWDMISDERRRQCINELIGYFENERDEKIGVIPATEILDLVLQNVAEDIHEKAIDDAKSLLRKRIEDLEVELTMLQRPK